MNWHWLIATPGWVVSLLTFPGVILHELAHKIMCDCFNIEVYEAAYFVPGDEKSGYIQHAPASGPMGAFAVALGPMLINTFACGVFGFIPLFKLIALDSLQPPDALDWVLLWASLSFGMHAFPSPEDALMVKAYCNDNNPFWLWKLLGNALFQFSILSHWGKMIWLDVAYALTVSVLSTLLYLKQF